jgi:flagellar basal-body rod protein FlgC
MSDAISFTPGKLFGAVDISASAMSGERLRMTVASENLAHAGDTRRHADGLPYQRQRVLFQEALDQQGAATGEVASATVKSPKYETRYDPSHPDANAEGIVHIPEISSILELTDLMTASKAYEANANAARGMLRMHENALRLGQE